jgi:hypothetical protein
MRCVVAALAVCVALAGCSHDPPEYVSTYTPPTATAVDSSQHPPFNPATVGQALESDRPYVISVLGDSTGNELGEWVDLIARRISAAYRRSVTVHDWNDDTSSYGAPRTYGEGAPVTVWNASARGKGPEYSRQWYREMAPDPVNLTIVNHSHNSLERSVPGISELVRIAYANTEPGGGVAVVLQNPRTDQFAARGQVTTDDLRRIYSDPNKGVVVIDVNAAFRGRDLAQLLKPDGLHPTESGSQLWADTVASALQLR